MVRRSYQSESPRSQPRAYRTAPHGSHAIEQPLHGILNPTHLTLQSAETSFTRLWPHLTYNILNMLPGSAGSPRKYAADTVTTATTMLSVPGDRPERFTKADAPGADLVFLDLEDAVAPARKDEARSHVVRRIENGPPCAVRESPWARRGTTRTSRHSCIIRARSCRPRQERPEDTLAVAVAVPGITGIVALIETASARARHGDGSPPRPPGATTGERHSFDLAVELGGALAQSRSDPRRKKRPGLASAAAGIVWLKANRRCDRIHRGRRRVARRRHLCPAPWPDREAAR